MLERWRLRRDFSAPSDWYFGNLIVIAWLCRTNQATFDGPGSLLPIGPAGCRPTV
jgi:hypothetical protein